MIVNLLILLETSFIFKLALILCCYLFCYFLFMKIFNEKNIKNEFKFKIYNHTKNLFYIYFYIGFNLYLIFVIRKNLIYKDIDLKVIFNNIIFKSFIGKNVLHNTLLLILYIFLIIIIILIFYKIHKFFTVELIKRYIFLLAPNDNTSLLLKKKCYNVMLYMIRNFLFDLYLKNIPSLKIISNNLLYDTYKKIVMFILYWLPYAFLFIYFIYLLLFNNCILTATFNKLSFVIAIYTIYKNISEFFIYQNEDINLMLYNMYYRSYSVKYVNLPDNYKSCIYDYINNNLKEKSFDPIFYTVNEFTYVVWRNHTYITTDGVSYHNNNNLVFFEENNKDIDEFKSSKLEFISSYDKFIYEN